VGAYYLDTSALVKRYVAEAGSSLVTSLTGPTSGNDICIATIGWVEIVAALYRRVRTGALPLADATRAENAFRQDLRHLFISWEPTPTILASAMALAKRHALRAYDSIQLATAIEIQTRLKFINLPGLRFLSADQHLNQATLAEGLLVDDPNRYP